jgi:hypothetical protein
LFLWRKGFRGPEKDCMRQMIGKEYKEEYKEEYEEKYKCNSTK